jgi:glycosyltransferase involved in cell wall biosynthesis
MPSISSDSSTKELDLPEVEVLLATFNGELYLSEFLDSLCNQQGVRIHLRVSDDGSTDETLAIVDLFKNEFASCKIYSGPQKGPSANFFSLIEKSTYEFVALADQDDIWFPNKLLNSILHFSAEHVPSLYTGTVCDLKGKSQSYDLYELPISIMRNRAQGCTMVFNGALRDLFLRLNPNKLVMHDWAILLIAQLHGIIYFDSKPNMYYRIHKNNYVGKSNYFFRLIRYTNSIFTSNSRKNVSIQALEIFKSKNFKEMNRQFDDWCDNAPGSLSARSSYLVRNFRIYGRSFAVFGCMFQILFGRYRV